MANQEYKEYEYHFNKKLLNEAVLKEYNNVKVLETSPGINCSKEEIEEVFIDGVHFAEHEIPVILDDFLKFLFINRRIKSYNPQIINDFLKTKQ